MQAIVIMNSKDRNIFTIINLKDKNNYEYMRFFLTENDIREILNGKTVMNCKLMSKLQGNKFNIAEDCFNNNGNNLNNIKIHNVHKLFVKYRIYKYDKYKIRVRNK